MALTRQVTPPCGASENAVVGWLQQKQRHRSNHEECRVIPSPGSHAMRRCLSPNTRQVRLEMSQNFHNKTRTDKNQNFEPDPSPLCWWSHRLDLISVRTAISGGAMVPEQCFERMDFHQSLCSHPTESCHFSFRNLHKSGILIVLALLSWLWN